MSFEDLEQRSTVRVVAGLSAQVEEGQGKVVLELMSLREEAQRVAAESRGRDRVAMGELLVRYGRARAVVDRQGDLLASIGELLSELNVALPAIAPEEG